jgi:hypothetical protein
MKIPAALVAILLALPGTALAQSTGGLNIAALVAQYESSDNPTAQNPDPGATSSGLYGFTNGTWRTYAQQIGVNTQEYPSAYLAPASVQTAVFAQTIRQNGLNDWTCAGCDPPLATAIQADGGLSGFDLNLSTNPADYASLDTSSGLQAYFAGNGSGTTGGGLPINPTGMTGGLPGYTSAGSGTGTGTTALPPVNSTPGALSLPFTWIYNQVIAATQQGSRQELCVAVRHCRT